MSPSNAETPYAVHCLNGHGKLYLTREEYNRQMCDAGSLWKCPVCRGIAQWDDENYEKWTTKRWPAQEAGE